SYTFSVVSVREEEADHAGADWAEPVAFVFPLAAPYITIAANNGGGAVALEWDAVHEATGYEIGEKNSAILPFTVTDCAAEVTGLTVGQTYTLTVTALRGEEKSTPAEAAVTITAEAETRWSYVASGPSMSLSKSGYEGNANEGSVRVWSMGSCGKLQPTATDGIAFYYTKIDPKTQNFELSATAEVNTWTYSNGQEGFGLIAADCIGPHGSSASTWTNSYMAHCTKVEYTIDGTKISMRLGVGAQEKIGITPDNIDGSSLIDNTKLSSKMTPLETSCLAKGAGTYNIVGNPSAAVAGTVENPYTTFDFTIGRNNTGYYISYNDPASGVQTVKYYEPDALNSLDPDNVYVGFFTARNADVTFKNISFKTSDPKTDPPAEDRPMAEVAPSYQVVSATVANKANYTMEYYGNADGILTVKNANGVELFSGTVKANTKTPVRLTLQKGENRFTLTMTPDASFKPSQYEILSSYEPQSFGFAVNYAVNQQEVVYVSPNGTADAAGTKEEPQDIYTAVSRAIPGQQILLTEGTYKLESGRLLIDRGIDGTLSKNIWLKADPDATTRPVLDFCQKSAGVVLAGNYWHFYGFDVTGSKDGEKGLQVSGNYNTLEQMETYRNGNTGIQLSRFKGTDETIADWPHDNLILNCTSYLNADSGMEDADGFAAKLTIGPGNVFDGCIACYNADDGWDLFAKPETGPIGMVVIQNSVAYRNGILLNENGSEKNAGNGNGFKMGGSSITGYHTLKNSVTFANKAKGIDSNSCPDIQAYQSTSFDNESYNVAFYTNDARNTDFAGNGIISYKKSNTTADNFKLLGTQDLTKVKNETNYFFENGKSANSLGEEVKDSWFVSLDTSAVVKGITKNAGEPVELGYITRNDDGSVNLHDYLKLTDEAPANVGARLENVEQAKPHEEPASEPGTPSVTPAAPAVAEETKRDENGNVTAVEVTISAAQDEVVSLNAPYETPVHVTVKDGGTVKVKLPVENPKPGTVAVLVAPDGTETILHDSLVGKDSITFPVTGEATVVVRNNAKVFDDVAADSWAKDAIDFVSARELFLGTSATTFSPKVPMTRAMFVTVLYRLAGEPAVGKADFDDVKPGSWYADAVAWAAAEGITQGAGTGFEPQRETTRQEIAVFLCRY
ncbi:MAG: S-layer homology domain-containing protein, partial [bacterium]